MSGPNPFQVDAFGRTRAIPLSGPVSHTDGRAVMARVRAERMGFLIESEVALLAADPVTRLELVLVRCGGCRFLVPADQAAHLIAIVTREGSDYVRDVSLPVSR